ncbi:hypothetical protein [Oceanirhabdus seepicola]|uniref:Uncharacterized protein n=1 Tax=Oceanirhabdus seepicola TaxID=2828781 RepID=A0A9J6P863_9CLOT|nr:hypothetical protein [Oceanirhabdus seepicola]MCM1992097.1 hypothetical protein [Oceanirhabdus seepicola]
MEKRGSVIIGFSIIIGFIMLGLLLKSPLESLSNNSAPISSNELSDLSKSVSELNRYQMISANDHNIILLDTKTGEYWRKFVPSNEGPTNWTKEIGPNLNK